MMLDHLGCPEAGASVMAAIEKVLASGLRTPDMGGQASTTDMGRAIADAV
jgi:tartrate dehydrogenase/decarboxylase/D-malate dehydrogenase